MKQNEPLNILVDFDNTFVLKLSNNEMFGTTISDRHLIITALNNYQHSGKSVDWLTDRFRKADKKIVLTDEECGVIENALTSLYAQFSAHYGDNWKKWGTGEQEQWKYRIDRTATLRSEIPSKGKAKNDKVEWLCCMKLTKKRCWPVPRKILNFFAGIWHSQSRHAIENHAADPRFNLLCFKGTRLKLRSNDRFITKYEIFR